MAKYTALIRFTAHNDEVADEAVREAVGSLQEYVDTDAKVVVAKDEYDYVLDPDGNEVSNSDDEDEE